MEEFSKDRSSKKLRVLTVSLIFSGVLNIGLIATGLFTGKEESKVYPFSYPVSNEKSRIEASIEQCFSDMLSFSFHQLVSYLTNKDPISEGYLKRDLALSALVASHNFHIEKALSGTSLQKREILLRDGSIGNLFPGLNCNHFDAIIRFAYEEKWPLTTEGLFKRMKKDHSLNEKSLIQAFTLTPEFRSLEFLFQKTNLKASRETLLSLVVEGSWEILELFAKEQQQLLDVSLERRRSLLLGYLALGSQTSAKMLLDTDYMFIAKKLEDQGIIHLLSLLKEKTAVSEHLCLELLRSPRSDAVWEAAAKNLYSYGKEEIPSPFNLKQAMSRFVSSPQKTLVEDAPKERCTHVVKEGETLWKIARLYNVKVDVLVEANEIDKNRLLPGMTLNIPTE